MNATIGSRWICFAMMMLLCCSCTSIRHKHDLANKESLPVIYEALETGSGRDKIDAVRALSRYHQEVPDLKERLVIATTDRVWQVQWEASGQLIRLGHYQEGITGYLEMTTNRNVEIKIKAIRAIQRQGYRAEFALPLLKTLTTNNRRAVENTARAAVGKIEADVLVHNLRQNQDKG